MGALFDLSFDHMVTVRVVKIIYLLSLVPYTMLALLLAGYGLDWLHRGSTWGYLLILTAPFLWFLLLLVTRIVLEFVINQFKISEYLRAIKDKR
ncbi:DUF4282 domain-containing protein [Actinomadura sp. B10D3]|uniref:DUF4282 domain-containing protein n=1 Tax=Actinomadura sp. B10D3 TaxID=3153557 RepID=UPI00325F2784